MNRSGFTKYHVLALTATIAIVLAGLTCLGLWLSGITKPSVVKSVPMGTPLRPEDFWPEKEGVLHIVTPRIAGTVSAGETGEAEIWFDAPNMRARQELRWDDGRVESLAVADGDYYGNYDAHGQSVLEHRLLDNGGWKYWLQSDGDLVVYQALVNQGQVDVRETTVEGVKALRLQIAVLGEDGQKEATQTVYLDKGTGLPIRFEREPVKGGEKEVGDVEYSVLEWVSQEDVDASLFKLPQHLLDVRYRTKETYMTIEEARGFRDFDVYYLGENPQGLKLWRLLDYSSTSPDTSIHYFAADYALASAPDEPALHIRSEVRDKDRIDPWNTPDNPLLSAEMGPKRDVSVHGTTGFLYSQGREANLWLQIGDTVIHISGDTEEQVLTAAEALARLNQ